MKTVDLHLANAIGLGAEKFTSALTQAILGVEGINVDNVYINRRAKSDEAFGDAKIIAVGYFLGWISRVVEIFFWRVYRSQENEIVTFGDLPLNTSSKQYILCQQSLAFKKLPFFTGSYLKFFFFRIIYRLFVKDTDVILVQSAEMAANVRAVINETVEVRILDLSGGQFGWPSFRRTGRAESRGTKQGLHLIYPAAFYEHKNHYLLKVIQPPRFSEVTVTIDPALFGEQKNWVNCVGLVSRQEVFQIYRTIDGLLFLSGDESLGMPILEAVKCNIPIICPSAFYTKTLKGQDCIFFDLNDPKTLTQAMQLLKERLEVGWWPDWNFEKVARHPDSMEIVDIILKSDA